MADQGGRKEVFGIDLGTTYSCIAHVDENGKPEVVPNAEGDRTTPSVIFFDGEDRIIGKVAKEQMKMSPDNVVAFVKRAMGDPNFAFEHNGQKYTPEMLSSFTLRKLVQDAEQNLGTKITDVVITHPAYFGMNEREATRNAGILAGLNVVRLIDEPTAAAISYAYERAEKIGEKDKVVLVYDLGGGTFDITMIAIHPPNGIEVICTGGNSQLGGKDWDTRVVTYAAEKFKEQTGVQEDILSDPSTLQSLMKQAEERRQDLSTLKKVSFSVSHGGQASEVVLTREQLEEMTKDLIEETITRTHTMLEEAKNPKDSKKAKYDKFDDFLLVGGMTKMPAIKARVKQEFGIEPISYQPDEAVARGAALLGWIETLKVEYTRVCEGLLGSKIEKPEDWSKVTPQVEREALAKFDVPDHIKQWFRTPPPPPAKPGDPPPKPRVGGNIGGPLQDVGSGVCPKSFGVVALDDNDKEFVSWIIRKQTKLPAENTEVFGTRWDNMTGVDIKLHEGDTESTVVADSQQVKLATLTLPPNTPRGTQVKVTFRLNDQGLLEGEAICGDRKAAITYEGAAVVTKEEIQKQRDVLQKQNVQ